MELLEGLIRTNILGVISITRKALQSILERKTSGIIINISLSADEGPKGLSAAVDNFTSELGRGIFHLGNPQIRMTNIKAENVRMEGDDEDNGDPLQILPKDVADAVAFCLSTSPQLQVKEIKLGATGKGL